MINDKIRILIVEDHPIYCEGLQLILTLSNINCEIVGQAANVRQAINWLETRTDGLDLVILDYFFPDGNASNVLTTLKKLFPQAKVLVITGEIDRPEVKASVEGKVDGFISKDIQPAMLPKMITSIMNSGNHPNAAAASVLADDRPEEKSLLTQRELEVVRMCVQGKNPKQIAKELNISSRTVERHKNNIFGKLGVKSSSELLKYAVLNGLV